MQLSLKEIRMDSTASLKIFHDNSTMASNQSEFVQADPGLCVTFAFMGALLMSILCGLGIMGNILSYFIFTRPCMRSSINVLLAGLSLVDTVVLIIAIPVFVVPGLNSCDAFGPLVGLHIATFFGLYQLGLMAQTCSIWTFVLISIERFLAVCRPLHVQRFFTVRRAKYAQLILVFLAALYNLIRFWEYELIYEDQDEEKFEFPLGYARLLRDNSAYFLAYYTVAYVVMHFVIPFSLITILNAKIIKCIFDAGIARYALTRGLGGQFGIRGRVDHKRQRQTTRMIIIVTAFFVLCNFLPFVLNVWEAINPSLFESAWRSVAYFALDISNLLVIFNSAMNFVVYLIHCRQYRRIFVRFFRARKVGKLIPEPSENSIDWKKALDRRRMAKDFGMARRGYLRENYVMERQRHHSIDGNCQFAIAV